MAQQAEVRRAAGALRRLPGFAVARLGGRGQLRSSEAGRSRWALHRPAVAVLAAGFVVTAILTAASAVNYSRNEQALTRLQARTTGAALSIAPDEVDRQLGTAVDLVAATGGDLATFERSVSSSLKGDPFADVLLFQVEPGAPRLLAHLGTTAMLGPSSARASAIVAEASRSPRLVVTRLLRPGAQRLGYAMSAKGPGGRRYVAYAEEVLPGDRRVALPPSSPLYHFAFALYYGHSETRRALLETNAGHLPIGGTSARVPVSFGSAELTLVLAPQGSLAGGFAEGVPYGIAVLGVLFTLGVTVLTDRLVRRRRVAEALAAENRELYRAQRGIAATLQHALLPASLPALPGLELAVRYLPGTAGVEVGGDFYDVVPTGAGRCIFVVGDVSGHGLPAATTMAALRFSIRAFLAEGHGPAEVLSRLYGLVSGAEGEMATVLLGEIDVAAHRLTLVSAGHLPAVLVEHGSARLLEARPGLPVGAWGEGPPRTLELEASAGATLLAFTDGLVERRGEVIDVGLERLRSAAAKEEGALREVLDRLIAELAPGGAEDDVALLGIRWRS